MEPIDWKELLRQNSLFSTLHFEEKEKLIVWLLDKKVSEERSFFSGEVILKEGDSGDSIFLIGSGSAQAVATNEKGEEISRLSILKKNDFFGEIAMLQEGERRSATVVANQECKLLEIKGQDFLNLLENHPDIEVKVLFKLAQRLRNTNDHLVSEKLKSIDDKLILFRSMLDGELNVIDAQLKATQAVFDQTKIRTDEVINSAERSRTRLTVAASTIGTFVSIIIAVFGLLGFEQISNIRKVGDTLNKKILEADVKLSKIDTKVKTVLETMETSQKKIDTFEKEIEISQKEIEISQKEIEILSTKLNDEVKDVIISTNNSIVDSVFMPMFRDALGKKNIQDAIKFYKIIEEQSLKSESSVKIILETILSDIGNLKKNEIMQDYTDLLEEIRNYVRTPEYDLFLYKFVSLVNAIGVDEEKFDSQFDKFENFISTYDGREKLVSDPGNVYLLDRLSKHFKAQDKETQKQFRRVERFIKKI